MITFSTKGIGNMNISGSNATTSAKKTKKTEDGGNFAGIMDLATSSSFSKNVNSDTKKVAETDTSSKSTSVKDKNDIASKKDDRAVAGEESRQTKNVSKDKTDSYSSKAEKTDSSVIDKKAVEANTDSEEVVAEAGTIDETVVEQFAAMLAQMLTEVSEKLGLSEDETKDLLDQMNLDVVDLLQNNHLKDFMLTAKSASEIDMLTDENLVIQLNDLEADIHAILADSDFEEATDDLLKTLSDAVTELNQEIQTVVEINDDITLKTTDEEVDDKTLSLTEDNGNLQVMNSDETVDISYEGSNASKNFGESSQTGNEQLAQGQNTIMNNLNQAIDVAFAEQIENQTSYSDTVSQADVVRQVIDNIKTDITREQTSIAITLNPESLGHVQISVTEKNGIMSAQIVAETEAAKNAIEGNIMMLQEAFNNQEIKVEAVEVTIASYDFFAEGGESQQEDESHEQSNTSKNKSLNLNELSDLDENVLSEEEMLEVDMMRTNGNQVSYSI